MGGNAGASFVGEEGNGGIGGDANGTSTATSAGTGSVVSTALAQGGAEGGADGQFFRCGNGGAKATLGANGGG